MDTASTTAATRQDFKLNIRALLFRVISTWARVGASADRCSCCSRSAANSAWAESLASKSAHQQIRGRARLTTRVEGDDAHPRRKACRQSAGTRARIRSEVRRWHVL